MATGEMEISQMLSKAKKVFDKFKDKVSMQKYKKVLSAIGVQVESEFELESYFSIVDLDEDGYVSYKDFEATILSPMMDDEAPVEEAVTDQLSIEERSLLTLEKLAEFKNLFDYYK